MESQSLTEQKREKRSKSIDVNIPGYENAAFRKMWQIKGNMESKCYETMKEIVSEKDFGEVYILPTEEMEGISVDVNTFEKYSLEYHRAVI